MDKSIRVLVIEDNPDDYELLLRALRRGGFSPDATMVDSENSLRTTLPRGQWDLVLSDHAMPGFNSLKVLEIIKETNHDIPFIIVSGTIGEDIAVSAMRQGAHDYILKNNLARLPAAVEREIGEAAMRRERIRAATSLQQNEVRLARINECLIGLGEDFDDNIQRLVETCGVLLDADHAMYNRIKEASLITVGQWQLPDHFDLEALHKSNFCTHLYHRMEDGLVVYRTVNHPSSEHIIDDQFFENFHTFMGTFVRNSTVKTGTLCVMYDRDVLPTDGDKELMRIVAAAIGQQEERRLAHLRINHALKEKELLLQEINHRVKNNLQIIVSLLNMQCRSTTIPEVRSQLREATNRVNSMAIVHMLLYQSENMSTINFQDYVSNLMKRLMSSLGRPSFRTVMEVDRISLPLDIAVPCGLILNELITNCLKHAFPNDESGTITIRMQQEPHTNMFTLTVEDTGMGFDFEEKTKAQPCFGMTIVSSLTKQLAGKLTVSQDNGTIVTLQFPLLEFSRS